MGLDVVVEDPVSTGGVLNDAGKLARAKTNFFQYNYYTGYTIIWVLEHDYSQ